MLRSPHTSCLRCPSSSTCVFSEISCDRDGQGPVRLKFRKGDNLVSEGSRAVGFYSLCKGHVKLTTSNRNGDEVLLTILGSGDVIGLSASLGLKTYSYSARALEDSEVCYIDSNHFDELIPNNPGTAIKALRKLSQQTFLAQERIKNLSCKSMRERFAMFLINLADQHGKMTDKGLEIMLKLSREELAASVGSVQETVIRLISAFKAEGVLVEENRHLVIVNLPEMKVISGSQ